VIDRELCCDVGGGVSESFDRAYLQELGLDEHVETWRRLHLPVFEESSVHA